MASVILQNYVTEQLLQLYYGKKCCEKFLWCFYYEYAEIFVTKIGQLNLNVQPCLYNNQKAILVYKRNCLHVIEDVLTLRLTPACIENMYSLLSCSNFIGSPSEMHISSDFLKPLTSWPVVTPRCFSFPLQVSVPHLNMEGYKRYQMTCPIQLYKAKVLDSLQRNRMLVVSGGPHLDKLGGIPLCIMEQLLGWNRLCKIICVEREQIIAIYNAERLAKYFNEPVGNTVGFQVHSQSYMSSSSSIIFTTVSYFLRVLMSQSIIKHFSFISHVIVADVHLHEAYTDILLHQLREALKYRSDLKVILLSAYTENQHFLRYFGEGEEVDLHDININRIGNRSLGTFRKNYPRIFYDNDIKHMLKDKILSKRAIEAFQYFSTVEKFTINSRYLDLCLERYEESAGDAMSFDHILYMVHGECASINYRHSISGRTAIILSCMYGKINHVKILLQLNADPTITDNQNISALEAAIQNNHLDCVELLKATFVSDRSQGHERNIKTQHIDYFLIVDIIYMITADVEKWKVGDIIVFLPAYEHLVKLNYYIAKQKIMGNIPEKLMVYLLHNDIEKSDLDAILMESPNLQKCILATEIAESVYYFKNIRYVIDTARRRQIVYNKNGQCKEYVYDWTPKQDLENRILLLQPEEDTYCFRLITSDIYRELPDSRVPEFLIIPLERVCLTVKLLAPDNMIAEFLDEIIIKPSFMQICQCIEYLKKINVLSDSEEITWWGCRLIDIPVDFQCGKLLILGVLLQCLDPILTIVSFMSTFDPLEISIYLDDLTQPFKDNLRLKIKEERMRLADNYLSDHIMYIHLYQEWQNMRRDSNSTLLMNDCRFILDGLLEYISVKRAQLVLSLRSSQLIHNKGPFSMNVINRKSNCWAIIKAVLAGGLYPNICFANTITKRLKSSRKRELVLHPNTVLRECELQTWHRNMPNFDSSWIIYSNETFSWSCNSITFCTTVSPIAIALFAGNLKMSTRNIQFLEELNPYDNTKYVTLVIDEWITFTMKYNDAQLLLRTRQFFYSTCLNFLQYCGVRENFPGGRFHATRNARLYNSLERILVEQEAIYNDRRPNNIGLRPKAIPLKALQNINKITTRMSSKNRQNYAVKILQIDKNCKIRSSLTVKENQYFLIHQNVIYDEEFKRNIITNIKLRLEETVYQCARIVNGIMVTNGINNKYKQERETTTIKGISKASIIYVITYATNPDKLLQVALVEWYDNDKIYLKDCFTNEIYLDDIRNIISMQGILPFAIQRNTPIIPVNRDVGEMIINLFAYRHQWLHNP